MNADECAQTAQGQIDGGDPRKLSAETISRPQLQPGMVDDDGVDICQPIQWTESLLVVIILGLGVTAPDTAYNRLPYNPLAGSAKAP
jgi:hypothetical protein